MNRLVLLSLTTSTALFTLACQQYPEVVNHGEVCVSAEEIDGQPVLVVEANSGDCASDHEGASFECTITTDGFDAAIETLFQDGKDPNDACAEPLITHCQVEAEPGTYTLEFAGEQYELVVPSDQTVCFPGGGPGDTEG